MDNQSFSSLQDAIFNSLLSTVKTASTLAATDITFQRTSNPDFGTSVDTTNARILSLADSLLKTAAAGSDLKKPNLKNADDVETSWGEVVEIVDCMLERADTCLDEYTGAIKQKNPQPLPGAWINTPRPTPSVQKATSWKSRKMAKPQMSFAVKPDNMDASPFKPLLTKKPHAKVTLDESLKTFVNEKGILQYVHPYATEIAALPYPRQMFAKKEPTPYLSFEHTKAEWVDTPEALATMLAELKKAGEIAVDLEHHDNRSYIGFVCLMQISTRWKDWIVDTLVLRQELEVLNEVFADPGIIKVLHGAYMDTVWLQRDFGLYLVGLFDTHSAAKALGFPGLGLAYLLKKYVNFDADKKYQLADWRIRPLPEEMFDYARSDTHFLLYIFDHLRNELLSRTPTSYSCTPTSWDPENSKLHRVLTDSKEISLRLYERENYDPVNGTGILGWKNLLIRNGDSLNGVQTIVFKAIHQWRDQVARKEDESLHFVMPRHQLYNLARHMPTDTAGVLSCCPGISQSVRFRAGNLADVIRAAKESPVAQEMKKKMTVAPAHLTVPVEVDQRPPRKVGVDVFASTETILFSKTSDFWGDAVGSSRWEDEALQEPNPANDNVRFAIPLPQLTAAIFVTTEDPEELEEKKVDPGARAEHEYVKERPEVRKEEDIIVVKSLGRKRKHDASAPTPNPEEPSATSGTASEKKKKKKQKKPEDSQTDTAANNELQAFDYANAPKIFNAPNAEARKDELNGGKKKKGKKVFDGYKGLGDAPKGMKRGQKEREGKGGTFGY